MSVANLNKWAKRAKVEHWEQGKLWYHDAHDYCQGLVGKYTLEQVVGVVAALSPQVEWDHNKSVACALLEGYEGEVYKGYDVNMTKARSVLDIKDPLTILGGQKVRAFYDNILRPRYSNLVTVDTHIARAFFNSLDLSQKELDFTFRPHGNGVIQEAVRTLADRYEVRPLALQATIWLAVKDAL